MDWFGARFHSSKRNWPVRRLLSAQFPRWAGLPVRRFDSTGTNNAIFRLGDDLVDTHAVLTAWERALAVPAWSGPPMCTHGDLLPGNATRTHW
jgi:aminoglycoside phosphotransferase (APT) family kinase protein